MLSKLIIAMVWVYRHTLSWLLGGHCRYNPSCSQYMIDAVNKYGAIRGAWRGIKRVCRCHPFSKHPYHDPA